MKISPRKLLAVLLISGTMMGVAAASILANYIVPSHVSITSTPGILVLDPGGPVTFFEWGDVQLGTSNSKTITVKNSQGSASLWLLEGSITSLTTSPALPPGISLTWDLASRYPVNNCPEAQPAGITGCIRLSPGQSTVTLMLTLAVSTTADSVGLNFDTVFNAYSTSTG